MARGLLRPAASAGAAFEAGAADVLTVEAFPFARRQMRFELLPLLEAAFGKWHAPATPKPVKNLGAPIPEAWDTLGKFTSAGHRAYNQRYE